MLCFRK